MATLDRIDNKNRDEHGNECKIKTKSLDIADVVSDKHTESCPKTQDKWTRPLRTKISRFGRSVWRRYSESWTAYASSVSSILNHTSSALFSLESRGAMEADSSMCLRLMMKVVETIDGSDPPTTMSCNAANWDAPA